MDKEQTNDLVQSFTQMRDFVQSGPLDSTLKDLLLTLIKDELYSELTLRLWTHQSQAAHEYLENKFQNF